MLKTESNKQIASVGHNAWKQSINYTMSRQACKVYQRNASTLVI